MKSANNDRWSKPIAESSPGREAKPVADAPRPGPAPTPSFIPTWPTKSFDTLIVAPSTRRSIQRGLNFYKNFDRLYDCWNFRSVNPDARRAAVISNAGPPGTGKGHAAHAIALELGKPIITIDYDQLESKYPGDTSKNIVLAFAEAEKTGSVLFFDEADTLVSRRLTNVAQSADGSFNAARSVMLIQLERFEGVCVFATNLLQSYDPAFMRRITAHVEFRLPDESERRLLWERFLPKETPRASDVTIDWLTSLTEGWSGGHMWKVVEAAGGQAVARGDDACLTRADIAEAIDDIRRAWAMHSGRDVTIPSVREEIVEAAQLPTSVSEALRAQSEDSGEVT